MPGTKPEAVYDYTDERGELLFQVLRYEPKDFRVRRPGPDGEWIWDLNGARKLLYNLPEVLIATHIVVVEGEKDAERVRKALRGFGKREGVQWAVTTVAGGARGWRSGYAPYFAGKCVFILPDADEAGETFGQDVARSVSGLARRVKIVELPDLPEKGDVSDYLEDHNAEELQQELGKARLYKQPNPSAAGVASNSFTLQSLRDYFDSPQEEQPWLVEGRLPAGGMSVMTAKPKIGKSTLARQLALDVSTGEPFLERETQQGAVLYFALEEKRQEVTNHFRDLGATGDEPIHIHCGSAPLAALEEARTLLRQYRPALLVVDPLFKFTRVKDGNDYAGMTAALEPILALARETGTHILVVHHSGKGERADPTDAILGSTAIFGNVDTAIMLAKHDSYRTISTSQRYGEDLPETVLDFDPDRRAVTLGASRDQAEQEKREQQILAFLESHPGALEADILEGVVGRRQNKVSALRSLVGTRIVRRGKGGKADPYRYSCSEDSDTVAGTRNQNSPNDPKKQGKIVVPVVPYGKETPGNKNGSDTGVPQPRASISGPRRTRIRRQKPKPRFRGVLEGLVIKSGLQ
jgi:5S rRNA maturation endonuclease (ribonuclease M5)